MYGLGGAHPFIKSRSLSADVMQYNTTNGYCFYPVDQAGIKWSVSGVDSSPCSLLGSIRVLQSHQWALSSVEEDFDTRCMDIMDAPQTQAQLRNDENMSIPSTPSKRCGILGRIRPFLARVSGDMGKVTAIPNMTTSSEGGDCHMGRAILLTSPSTDLRVSHMHAANATAKHTNIFWGENRVKTVLWYPRIAPTPLPLVMGILLWSCSAASPSPLLGCWII